MLNLTLKVLRSALVAVLVLGGAMQASGAERKSLVLAVIPTAPPVTLHTRWTPFIERLSRETGLALRLKLYEEMAEFERDIWDGVPDFIFASPIQAMVAHRSAGYIPLVRGGDMVAVGLYVRRDSPITSIDDLRGKKIAFVGNKNLCSVAIRHLLAEHKEKLSYTTEYAGSTRNAIINVLLGKSDAGALFVSELAREPEETSNQLRAVLMTPQIAPHPLSAHPRVPRADRESVKQATLAIASTKDGAELVKALRFPAPVAADYDRDYRSLEAIDVKGLTNWGQ